MLGAFKVGLVQILQGVAGMVGALAMVAGAPDAPAKGSKANKGGKAKKGVGPPQRNVVSEAEREIILRTVEAGFAAFQESDKEPSTMDVHRVYQSAAGVMTVSCSTLTADQKLDVVKNLVKNTRKRSKHRMGLTLDWGPNLISHVRDREGAVGQPNKKQKAAAAKKANKPSKKASMPSRGRLRRIYTP